MTTDLDLTQPHAIHVVGVGGAGMSAIAIVLARMGHTVSGSDLRESRVLERLELLDITTSIGHAAEHLPAELDAVVISTAIPEHNPEVVAARERGIPFFGICLGMQCAVIEFGRNVMNLNDAHSTEFSKDTPHPVICLLDEQKTITDKGGTMRLGA